MEASPVWKMQMQTRSYINGTGKPEVSSILWASFGLMRWEKNLEGMAAVMTKILKAVRAFTRGMVAKPVPMNKALRVTTEGVRRYPSWTRLHKECKI